MSHTPGPWFVTEGEATDCLIIANDESTIAVLENAPIQGVCDRDNGRLIAAAPELLEACKEAKDAAWLSGIHQTPDGALCPWYAKLLAAIAKAESPPES